ncbi:MAG: universal stress protein [Planctomycetota bacterium]
MIGKILVGLGGTHYAEAATRTAIEIAKRHDAAVTGVTVANMERLHNTGARPIGAGGVAKELGDRRVAVTRQAMTADIDQFAELCSTAGVEFDIKKEERDEPFDFLRSQARYHDLTVLGLQAIFEYGAPGVFGDDPAAAIVKLIAGGVRPLIATPADYKPVQRVLIAYGGSVESAATLRRFAQLRPWTDMTARVATFGIDAERSARLLSHAADYCRSQKLTAETHAYECGPGQLLAEAKAWGADLIVLGNSGKRLLLQRVLGETALRVIREAQQPLFLGQ